MSQFRFSLGDQVKIACSGEEGKVIGRAEHLRIGNQYNLEYKAADGRAVTQWWDEEALDLVTSDSEEG